MTKISAALCLLVWCALLRSSILQLIPLSQKDKIVQMITPIIKHRSLSKSDIESLVKLMEQSSAEKLFEKNENQEIKQYNDLDATLETVKRKLDDMGHLRFGRNSKMQNKLRIKYADPDYGHMRFGR